MQGQRVSNPMIVSRLYVEGADDIGFAEMGISVEPDLEDFRTRTSRVVAYQRATGAYPGTQLMLEGGHLVLIELSFEEFDQLYGSYLR